MKKLCVQKLQELANKKDIIFVERARNALLICAEKLGQIKKGKYLLIPSEGGWINYAKLAKLANKELIRIPVINGKLDLEELSKYKDSILVFHTMPGYAYKDNVKKIEEICKKNNTFFLNDACGSIGTNDAKCGDLVLCSFGKDKPINLGIGGMIAYNKKQINFEDIKEFDKIDFNKLLELLNKLPSKLKYWQNIARKIKEDNEEYVLNKGPMGINVLLGFFSDEQRERLINYCLEHDYEYTICPRYIRTLKKAISVEIKRIH